MKRQIQIIIFILTLPMVGMCQKKFSVGANINSQISILTIKDSNAPSGIDEKTGLGVGYSLGLQAQYNINEKLFLRSGIQYQNRINRHKIGGLRYPSGIASMQNDITIISMGIPVDFGYSIQSKNQKMNYVIGLGGVINGPVDTKTEAKVLHEQMDDEKLTQAENIVDESVYSVGIFGGMEININEKTVLGIEPNVRFTPNNFFLYPYDSRASTIETGITLSIKIK